MPPKEVKLVKVYKSIAFTPPAKVMQILKLVHKQRMLIYVDNDKIDVTPMRPGQPKPSYECWIRNVYSGHNKTSLVLPAPVIDMFHLKAGDSLMIRIGDVDGRKFIMLKPSRPTVHVRMKHQGEKSVVEIYPLTPDGKIDETRDPIIKAVPYAEAHGISKSLEDGDKVKLENEVDATRPIDMAVPKGYKPEVFLKRGEKQAAPEGEEDESHNA